MRETRREFNIGTESSILVWQSQYAQGGLAALERKPRERPQIKPFKPPTKLLSELTQAEVEQNMPRKGNCLDNAIMENFFGIFKTGLDKYMRYYNHDRNKEK